MLLNVLKNNYFKSLAMAGTKFLFTMVCVGMAVVFGQETCSRDDPDRSVKDSTELLEVLIEEIKQMNEAQRSTCDGQRMMANISAAISEIRRDLQSAAEVSGKQNRNVTIALEKMEKQHTTEIQALKDQILRLAAGL